MIRLLLAKMPILLYQLTLLGMREFDIVLQ